MGRWTDSQAIPPFPNGKPALSAGDSDGDESYGIQAINDPFAASGAGDETATRRGDNMPGEG